MKKIIVAFAAVLIAVAAQAATVKWTAGNVYEMGSTSVKGAGYLVTFISTDAYAYATAVADLSAGDATFLTKGIAPKATGSTGMATQNITTTAGNSEAWEGYLVILNAATLDSATHAFISDVKNGATGATGQTLNLSWTSLTGTQDANNWAALAPEPTSGLLMLLGMGALALRRGRRA